MEKLEIGIKILILMSSSYLYPKLSKLGSWFLVCNLILTKLEEILRKTGNVVEVVFQIRILRSSSYLSPELSKLGGWFLVCNLILTKQEKILRQNWKCCWVCLPNLDFKVFWKDTLKTLTNQTCPELGTAWPQLVLNTLI